MKITFLGTSHGVPSATRHCTSTMLEVNGAIYLIDAGAPIVEVLTQRGVDFNKIRTIFTTHIHGDHTGGIIHFVDICNWFYRQANVDIYLTEAHAAQVFTNVIECMEAGPLKKERLRFQLMTADTVYEDENIRVTPIETRHMRDVGCKSYALLVEAEGKSVLFTGDLSHHLSEKDFPAIAMERPLDLMITEFAHFDLSESEEYFARVKAKKVFFTHLNVERKGADVETISKRYGYPASCPNDGDEYIL